ncbi:hypothetical protein BsWGS_11160 [Bradybaena similaris]
MAGNHLDCSKPLLVSSLTDKWPCRSWTFTTLADLLGNNRFSCHVAPKSCDQKMETQCSHQDVTLKEFCDWLDGRAKDSSPLSDFAREGNSCYIDYKYMKDMFEEHPHIFEEVRWEDFGLAGFTGYDSTIWLSSEGANTPGHQDTYGFNLITQICGRKLWILFPPEDGGYLYPTRVPYEESSIFSEVNIRKPNLQSHPQFKQLSHPYVVTLQPGQTLYVPRHWWHYVESLEPSISINVWVPVKEDRDSRFSEAITRCLATSLISSLDTSNMGELQAEWLNPTEDLAPTALNLLLLKASLGQMLEDPHAREGFVSADGKPAVNEDSVCTNESTKQSCLVRGLIQQHNCLQDLKQGDLPHGLIQQSDCSQDLKQGDLSPGLQQDYLQHRLMQQGGFQKDRETKKTDDSDLQSQMKICEHNRRTCQNVQEDANLQAGNLPINIEPAGQSDRASDQSMLSLFMENMKGYEMCRADTPFQCDFERSLPAKQVFDPHGSSPKKAKTYPNVAKAPSNTRQILSTETLYPRVFSLNACSFDTYLNLLYNLCRQNKCRQCCVDSGTAINITASGTDRNNFPTCTKATSNVSQGRSSVTCAASLEVANASNIDNERDVCSVLYGSRKRKTSVDCKDEECGGISGDGSEMEENDAGDKVSGCVDTDSLLGGSCFLSQLEIAEILLSCTLHPNVVELISQLFRDKCQNRLKQFR